MDFFNTDYMIVEPLGWNQLWYKEIPQNFKWEPVVVKEFICRCIYCCLDKPRMCCRQFIK